MNTSFDLSLITRAKSHSTRTAIISAEGQFTYQQLLDLSQQVAAKILNQRSDLKETRVAFLVPSGIHYVAIQWGIWRAGGIAVPLCTSHPLPELAYVLDDAEAEIVICHPQYEERLAPLARKRGVRFISTEELYGAKNVTLPSIDPHRRAMMVYTSGTTSRPKGVVTTHKNIEVQVRSLIEAWEWRADDRILHVLPLHHVHGIVNVLTCAMWAGATCEMLPKFDAQKTWACFVEGKITLFMAVPTIYIKLIAAWEAASTEQKKVMSQACAKMRLMVSGSAALPVSVLKKWKEISGHTLLERYGMTEIGMALSNPLHGKRVPGGVGMPLPFVEIRLVDENGQPVEPGQPGEIQVKGPCVFRQYWKKPEATKEAFRDDWFCTGDVAVREDDGYRLLGRESVDIIKTGGYKVSALEIEEVLRTHPALAECAVVGVADEEWGECVCAALVLNEAQSLTLEALREWAKERLASYKAPSRILIVDDLPRNAMGKVVKPEVVKLFK